MLRSRLAANVYSYRKYKNFNQKDLAVRAKVNVSQIGYIENQRISTTIDILERLAASFSVDPCLLLARNILKMPGTGIKQQSIVPTFFTEGVAAYAF